MQTAKPKIAAGETPSVTDRGSTMTVESVPAEPTTRAKARTGMSVVLTPNTAVKPVVMAPLRKTA